MRPSFIVVGAMKSGTSSLYNYLKRHPAICMSRIKETNYLLEKNFSKGLAWYLSLFDDHNLLCGEASPNYTKRHLFPGVPGRLYELSPGARLIYLVRDPLDRIVSHYVHNYVKGRDRTPFSQSVTSGENNYLLTSRYFYQIDAFRRYFPDDRILIVAAENLRRKRKSTVRSVFRFLGVDPTYYSASFRREYHVTTNKRSQPSDCSPVSGGDPQSAHSDSMPGSPLPRPSLTEYDRAILRDRLYQDVEALRAWSGMSFDQWSV